MLLRTESLADGVGRLTELAKLPRLGRPTAVIGSDLATLQFLKSGMLAIRP